jgi:hypothetical protein
MRGKWIGLPLGVALAATLVACSSAPTPSPARTSAAAVASPTSTATTTQPATAPTGDAVAVKHRGTICACGMVGPYPIIIPTDNGPDDGATGTVELGPDGTPEAYVLGDGDRRAQVLQRFGLINDFATQQLDYLDTINQVRRGTRPSFDYGDTINLSAYTITSIGDVDGDVLDDPPPDPLPPQR